jgi:hypothetical protein
VATTKIGWPLLQELEVGCHETEIGPLMMRNGYAGLYFGRVSLEVQVCRIKDTSALVQSGVLVLSVFAQWCWVYWHSPVYRCAAYWHSHLCIGVLESVVWVLSLYWVLIGYPVHLHSTLLPCQECWSHDDGRWVQLSSLKHVSEACHAIRDRNISLTALLGTRAEHSKQSRHQTA